MAVRANAVERFFGRRAGGHTPLPTRGPAWQRFISPPKVKDVEDQGVVAHTRVACAMLCGAAVTAPVEALGNTAAVTLRLPNAVFEAYRTTWRTPKVGPKIKGLTSVLIPVAAATLPPLAAVASTLWGLGYGAYAGAQYGALNAVRPAFGHIDKIWQLGAADALSHFTEEMRAPLKPGEEVFDIRILEAGHGLVGGVASAAIEAVVAGAIGVYRMPGAWWRLWTAGVPKVAEESVPISLAVGILGTAVVPVAAALCPVAGAFFGLGEGAVEGYRRGVAAALGKSVSRVGDFWKWSGKLVWARWD